MHIYIYSYRFFNLIFLFYQCWLHEYREDIAYLRMSERVPELYITMVGYSRNMDGFTTLHCGETENKFINSPDYTIGPVKQSFSA